MSGLAETIRRLHELREELAAHDVTARRRADDLKQDILACQQQLENAAAGLDEDKIALAKSVLHIRGTYKGGGGERASVVADAMKQLATGQPITPRFGDLWQRYFGTKDYDCWHGQRSDHEYGYGPKHGHIIFAVGLTQAVRERIPRGLAPDETEAALYYLANIERIEAALAKAEGRK